MSNLTEAVGNEFKRLNARVKELEDMLEDVANELDLSQSAIEEHGQHGTAPAQLVNLVLAEKDRKIAMLKSGIGEVPTEVSKQSLDVLGGDDYEEFGDDPI